MRRIAIALLLLPVLSVAQLTEAERSGIEEALSVGNLRLSDLDFERKPFADPYRLPLVTRAIDLPLASADELMALHAGTKGKSVSQLLAQLLEQAYELPLGAIQHDPPITGLDELPDDLRSPILGLANWINSANNEIRRATGDLSPDERRLLIESLPVWAVEEPEVSFSFVRGRTADQAEILALLERVDLNRILSAATRLAEAVERATEQLSWSIEDVETKKYKIGGMPIVIGGRGDDRHTDTDALLTVDLGGNDTYVGRHGAGVGYAAVLIDLSGNDTYDVGDLNIGAAVLGIGLAYDGGGRDTFTGESITFGSGLAGVGAFQKSGGNDTYRSATLTQGFGQFGIGLLLDSGGQDKYHLLLYGQGASRTRGVGWLVDSEGTDEYRAGGLILNSPLFATAHYSFAQGFSMGYREDTGGISGGAGLLTDHGGDDFYLGETYQQAASYWFALGTLYDASGNDTYTGHHYCQSSAMHACAAYLFDLDGHDGYIVKVGAAHAIGHDYGLAFLLDRAGDDVYASRDSTPGIGNANGLGLFVEGGGIDRYHGPPGKGNGARGSGSLGVFVDVNGDDMYKFGLNDGEASARTTWGVALDRPTALVLPTGETSQERDPVVVGSQEMKDDAGMAQVYAKATQWGVGTAQAEVADNLDLLVAIGPDALEWMLDNRLATANRLHIRAYVHVVRALGDDGARLVGAKALRATDQEMLPLIRIASDARVMDFGAVLPGLLKKPTLQRSAVAAAGTLKATAAVPELMSLCRSDDRLLARAAMVALLQIEDPASTGTAQAMLTASDLLTRKSALRLMVKFPETAMSAGKGLARDSNEFRARIGIELLGALGTDDALLEIGGFLLDPRPGVRIEALQRLAGRCPSQFRGDFASLKSDPVSLVRSVAVRLEAGE